MKLLICFLFTLFTTITLGQALQGDFTVLTYNIYHGANPNDAGKTNLKEIANLIMDLKPDFVALQEIDSMTLRSQEIFGRKVDIVQKLAAMTGYTGFFAKAMNFSEGGYGEGLLVKGEASFYPQQLSIPAGGEPRSAVWAKISLGNGREFLVGGTHLCHQFEENRSAQVRDLLSYSQSRALPIVLMGDFNFSPNSSSYDLIPDNWGDAALGFEPKTPTYGNAETGERIDYIFYDREQFEILDYKVITVPYSDHFPVWSKIRMKH